MNSKYELTAEKILDNWYRFKKHIDECIKEPRREALQKLYKDIEEYIISAPAAISLTNHNCIVGGYVDHVNRVVDVALDLLVTWEKYGGKQDFTVEELVFACINHDLGKLGIPGIPGTLENDNDWEINKLNKLYKYNTNLGFSTVPDRSLYVLQSRGIILTPNEYLAIKIHDGLYDESNKPYLVSYQVESRLRNYLPILVHQADMLASRVEWEFEWFDKVNKVGTPVKKTSIKTTPRPSEEALKRLVSDNPAVLAAFKNL